MIEALKHFALEASLGAIALALIGAGLALMIAEDAVIERMPIVGRWVLSIRHAAASVLIGAGFAVLGIVAGYAYRGAEDHSAALRAQIAARDAIIKEKDRQAAASKIIAQAAAGRAEIAERAEAERQEEVVRYAEELAKRPAESRCALSGDDVRWLRIPERGGPAAAPEPPRRPFGLR